MLLITHILSAITVGYIFKFWKNNNKRTYNSSALSTSTLKISNLGEAIAKSISNATSSVMMIGGFIVMFSVIISIFHESNFISILKIIVAPFFKFLKIPSDFITPILTGILEITNGISLISNIHIKAISINMILSSFLLGTGGISVFLQVLSITSKTDLSIKPYIIGKILHGFLAAFYTFIFIQIFPIFNFNL